MASISVARSTVVVGADVVVVVVVGSETALVVVAGREVPGAGAGGMYSLAVHDGLPVAG